MVPPSHLLQSEFSSRDRKFTFGIGMLMLIGTGHDGEQLVARHLRSSRSHEWIVPALSGCGESCQEDAVRQHSEAIS
jgi:hypothetical protein